MNDPNELKSITPIPQIDAFFQVRARATYYADFIRVYVPKTPYEKLSPNLEPQSTVSSQAIVTEYTEKTSNETDKERSIRRTKRAVKDYVLMNPFDMFATFTFRSDRYDIDKIKSKMANWLKSQQKRNGQFSYLIVPEFHKDGALHFHALVNGYTGKVNRSYGSNTGQPLKENGRDVYELPGYKLGFNSVIYIDDNPESRGKVGSYLLKYITKDMPVIFGQNRYWVSKGLKKPKSEDNPEKWYEQVKPDRTFINEYGVFMEFKKGHPIVDMFLEANQ